MRNRINKLISAALAFCMICSLLSVSVFAADDAAAVNIKIEDIKENVVSITASAEKVATIILASYKSEMLSNMKLAENVKILVGTNDYTVEGFEKGECDAVKAFVWENKNGAYVPLCDPLEELQISAVGTVKIEGGLPEMGVQIQASENITAAVPQNVELTENATQLTLSVTTKDESESGIPAAETEKLLSLDVHIDGISRTNTVPIEVDLGSVLDPYMNSSAIKLYHIENGETVPMTYVANDMPFTAHNQFKYNPATGGLIVNLATFSEIATVSDTTNVWTGVEDTSWYTGHEQDNEYTLYTAEQLAGFGKLVRGYGYANGVPLENIDSVNFARKTVKLGADIEIHSEDPGEKNRDRYFYPIGDYDNPFSGTFDGMGHTISSLYQNGWNMGEDPANQKYYDAHLGLFAYVYDGTVQNLTVDNFDLIMELCDVGCVAAYAGGTSSFKNIAVVNSDASSYNKRVAGVVGSNPNKDNGATLYFENITVDNTNTFHSLWGTYDCATAAILGKLEADSSADLKNCHASAKLDVYNDVCGNYQYYWYRYCGMMIGTVSRTQQLNGYTTIDLSKVTTQNCTVNFGDWNDYYYCEFEANGHPSYSGPDDYKFSRIPESELETDGNGNVVCKHEHTEAEDNRAVYLPFDQVFGGKGWGVKGKDLDELKGIEDITPGREESEVKFSSKVENNSDAYSGKDYKVSEFFESIPGKTVVSQSVVVSITSVDKNETVGVYTQNTENWTEGTIVFNEGFSGAVKLTIQDYQFCKPTTVYLNVVPYFVGTINFQNFLEINAAN